MKIGGKVINSAYEDVVVFPRPDGDLVFKIRAVLDNDVFEKLCPAPEPPTVIRPGNVKSVDLNDLKYKEKFQQWAQNKTHWMFISSLSATEGLEWDTVKLDNPDTFSNWTSDLKKAGFSYPEINHLAGKISEVNGLNDSKLDEAKQRFLATQVVTPEL